MTRRPGRGAEKGGKEARIKSPRPAMSFRMRPLVVYASCVAAVAPAMYVLVYQPFFEPGPPLAQGWAYQVTTIAAMATIATVFGVGAMLRPVPSLVGAVVATALTPVTCILPSPFEFIWAGWCLGTLARWILLFSRFVSRIVTRLAKPRRRGGADSINEPA